MKTLNRDYIEQQTGYRPFTTFYEDLSIAEPFGLKAVKDTYKSVYKCWRNDYKYWTEFVLILNWKAWDYCKNNYPLSDLYSELYYIARDYALDNFTDEQKKYFLDLID